MNETLNLIDYAILISVALSKINNEFTSQSLLLAKM